jgi:putative membrane protein
MKLKQLLFVSLLTGITLASCTKDEDQLNNTDRNFMLNASVSNTAEIDAANLALSISTNAVVRDYAQHMINEHTTAQNDLKTLGTSVDFMINDTLSPVHQANRLHLSKFTGNQFDSAYMHSQINDHEVTMLNFRNEQANGQHRDVRNYADTYMPHLREHTERADSIAGIYFRRR